jgi:hypothetical protein
MAASRTSSPRSASLSLSPYRFSAWRIRMTCLAGGKPSRSENWRASNADMHKLASVLIAFLTSEYIQVLLCIITSVLCFLLYRFHPLSFESLLLSCPLYIITFILFPLHQHFYNLPPFLLSLLFAAEVHKGDAVGFLWGVNFNFN